MERGQASFGLISRHMKSPLQSDKIKLQLDGGFNKQTKISLKRRERYTITVWFTMRNEGRKITGAERNREMQSLQRERESQIGKAGSSHDAIVISVN